MDEMTEKQEVSIRIVEAIGTTTLNNGSQLTAVNYFKNSRDEYRNHKL